MQWQEVSENWAAFAPRIMTRWPHLNENEVLAVDGNQTEFLAYLASFSDMDQTIAQSELDEWLLGEQSTDAVMHPSRDNERISDAMENVPKYRDPLSDDKHFGDDLTPDTPIDRS